MTSGQITEELNRRDTERYTDAQGLDPASTGPTDQAITDALHQRDPAWWADIQTARTRFAAYLKETGKAV